MKDSTVIYFFVVFIGAALYFAPTFIAALRNHKNAVAIMLLNVFLGWTFLGWVGAFIWSVLDQKKR